MNLKKSYLISSLLLLGSDICAMDLASSDAQVRITYQNVEEKSLEISSTDKFDEAIHYVKTYFVNPNFLVLDTEKEVNPQFYSAEVALLDHLTLQGDFQKASEIIDETVKKNSEEKIFNGYVADQKIGLLHLTNKNYLELQNRVSTHDSKMLRRDFYALGSFGLSAFFVGCLNYCSKIAIHPERKKYILPSIAGIIGSLWLAKKSLSSEHAHWSQRETTKKFLSIYKEKIKSKIDSLNKL